MINVRRLFKSDSKSTKFENKTKRNESSEENIEAVNSDENSIFLNNDEQSSSDITIDIPNELIQNNDKVIEIIQTVDKCELSENVLNKLVENYGKVKKSIIIQLISHSACVILWKTKKIEKFIQLNLNYDLENVEDLYELAKIFIRKSLEEDHLALSENLIENNKWTQAKRLDVTQLADSRGYNLFIYAAEVSSISLIDLLLKIGFSVNDRIDNKTYVADIAWINKNYQFLAILMQNNSRFPDDFRNYKGDYTEFPRSFKNFIILSQNFNDAFDEGDQEKLKDLIDKNQHLRHFYSFFNMSAPIYALYKNNLEVYEFFIVNNVIFAPIDPITQIMKKLTPAERKKLGKIHIEHQKVLPEQHITALIANTNLGHDIDNLDEKRNLVETAYYHLNSLAIIQIILRCVAASKKFSIIFDFNRSHVQFLDPTEDADSDGLFDSSVGRLSIAAQNIFNDDTKNGVFATIAHELCHYAMFLVYNNNGKPYHKGDKLRKMKFERITRHCERRSKKEVWINAVFETYDDFMWHAELIVRVPHLTALYFDQPKKLEKMRKIFKPLFDFYEGTVMKDMEKALPMIDKREEEKKRKRKKENWILRIFIALLFIFTIIAGPLLYLFLQPDDLDNYKWDKLSTDQQSRILSSDFDFQGQKVAIKHLLNDTRLDIDPILIHDFLKYDKFIKIGKSVDNKKKFYIKRQFTSENKSFNFHDIVNRVKNNSLNSFILSDESGTGKSTTFVNLTEKLKSKFPHKWISFVVLRDFIENFKTYNENEPIEDFLSKNILNLTDFNSKIFKKLFHDNQVIFLWDGFDEISPTYESPVLKLLSKINSIQFVSTRTLYTEKLENTFNTKSHKFIPYNEDDRDDFVIAYAEENEYTISEAIKSQSHLEKFLKKVRENDETRDVNNPLMLEIFLKTFREKLKLNIRDISINFYSLYDGFMKTKYELYKDKFKNDENLLCRELTNEDHEALSLSFIFNDIGIRDNQTNEIINVSSFDIHKKVSGIDYVKLAHIGIIDLDSKGEYHFGHRTFAEFFIAKYLIDKFYIREDYHPRDEELILRLNLLFQVLSDDNFKITQQFVEDYLRDVKVSQSNSSYVNVVEKNFKNIFDYYFLSDESLTFVDRVSNFFKNEREILNSFWRFNDNETFFIWYFKECSSDNFDEIFILSRKYYPNETDQNKLFLGINQKSGILLNFWLLKNNKKPLWKKFYSQYFNNDDRFKRLDNIDFLNLFPTNNEDIKEMLMRNSFKVLQETYDNPNNFDDTWSVIDNALNQSEKIKFLMGTNWKHNDTILHGIVSKESIKTAIKMLNTVNNNLNSSQINEMIFWVNFKSETSFIKVSNYLDVIDIRNFWNFTCNNLDSSSLKRLLTVKNSDGNSPIVSCLMNKNRGVFPYIEGLYKYYLSQDEIREHLKYSLKSKKIGIDERNVEIFIKFIERIYIQNDSKQLFSLTDSNFVEIIKKFLISDKMPSSLISFLIKNLTSDEKEQIAYEQSKRVKDFVTDLGYNSQEIIDSTINFYTQSLNILNESQIYFFKYFSKNEKFNQMLIELGSSSKSIYSVFESSIKSQNNNTKDIFIEAQFIAIQSKLFGGINIGIGLVREFRSFMKPYVKINDSDIYTFSYQPYEDFFAAQFFIQNLYDNFNIESLVGNYTIAYENLIHIWSLKCDCQKVSKLITNYIENENEKAPFDPLFRNFVLSEKCSDLFLDIDITMIEDATIFFKKDDEILRKLWRIDDDESLYYKFIVSEKLDEFDYVYSIGMKFFDDFDLLKIKNLSGKKGKILFYVWNSQHDLNRFDFEKTFFTLNIDVKNISFEKFIEIKNSVEYFNYIDDKLRLSDDEKKQMIYVNTHMFFFLDLLNNNLHEFTLFWSKVTQLLTDDELREIFIQNDGDYTVLHGLPYIQSKEIYETFLANLTKILTKSQFFEMMTAKQYEKSPFMAVSITPNLFNSAEILWNITERKLNNSQLLKEILNIRDDSNATALHYFFFYNVLVSDFVLNLYERYFSLNERMDMIMHADNEITHNYIAYSHNFPAVFEYLLKIFANHKEKFLIFLGRKDKLGLTIFQKFKSQIMSDYDASTLSENEKIAQSSLLMLICFIKTNYIPDEWKAIGIE